MVIARNWRASLIVACMWCMPAVSAHSLQRQSNTVKGSTSERDLTFRVLKIPEIQSRFVGDATKADRIPRGQRVFDSDKDWNKFRAELDARNLPKIDFSRRRVVGIFLGQMTAGWSVHIDRVTYSEATNETIVSYVVGEPRPGGVYPAVMGYPLVVAEIEQRPGSVSFIRHANPPK
jgi:hypothetical protein